MLSLLRKYRGVPTKGLYAGRQLFISAWQKNRSELNQLVTHNRLPQDCTIENQLSHLIDEINLLLNYISTMIQKYRVGFV